MRAEPAAAIPIRRASRADVPAIARARERSRRIVQLTTNASRAAPQRFYARLGFAPSHVGMKLDLTCEHTSRLPGRTRRSALFRVKQADLVGL